MNYFGHITRNDTVTLWNDFIVAPAASAYPDASGTVLIAAIKLSKESPSSGVLRFINFATSR